MVWDQRVAGSNPATPTTKALFASGENGFCFLSVKSSAFISVKTKSIFRTK